MFQTMFKCLNFAEYNFFYRMFHCTEYNIVFQLCGNRNKRKIMLFW